MKNLFLLISGLLLLIACNKDKAIEEFKPYYGPKLEADNVETIYTDSSVTRMKLKAKKQLEMQNGDRIFPQGIHVEFFDEHGILSSTIDGNQGKYFKDKHLYVLTGNGVVKNVVEKKQLNGEELFWEPNSKKNIFKKISKNKNSNGKSVWDIHDSGSGSDPLQHKESGRRSL